MNRTNGISRRLAASLKVLLPVAAIVSAMSLRIGAEEKAEQPTAELLAASYYEKGAARRQMSLYRRIGPAAESGKKGIWVVDSPADDSAHGLVVLTADLPSGAKGGPAPQASADIGYLPLRRETFLVVARPAGAALRLSVYRVDPAKAAGDRPAAMPEPAKPLSEVDVAGPAGRRIRTLLVPRHDHLLIVLERLDAKASPNLYRFDLKTQEWFELTATQVKTDTE